MSNPYNGSKTGKRGTNNQHRLSRKGFRESNKESMSAVVAAAGIYNEHASCSETIEDHIIPRQSLTNKLHLRLFPVRVETEARVTRQLDKSDPHKKRMITTTDEQPVWKSDKTLLRTNKVEARIPDFTRITSQTKRRKFEPELPAVVEVVIDPDLWID